MKLVMDERVKHRLIGLAVILSIGAIFAPAIMKKSSQRIDGNTSISIRLPQKPTQPEIDMVEKKAMFDASKVAQVERSNLREKEILPSNLAKAEPLNTANVQAKQGKLIGQALALADTEELSAKREGATHSSSVALAHKVAKGIQLPGHSVTKPKAVAKINKQTSPVKQKLAAKPAVKPSKSYSIQLATFSLQTNADSLVARLKEKGYTAIVTKIKSSQGVVYKVSVGQVSKREQAQALQTKIANLVQIKGFIISTGEG